MKKIRIELLSLILLTIVFGFLSGILGYVFIALGGNRLPLFGQINISDSGWNNQIVIDQPRSVTVEQDIQLKQVENDVLPTLVNIYHGKQSANPIIQAYLPSEILAGGIVITADGWVISTKKSIPLLTGNYAIIGYQSKNYKVSKFIEDKTTGLVFGKSDANNLTVAKIGDSAGLRVGQTLAVVSKNKGITLVNIEKIGYQFDVAADLIISSEELNKEIVLNIDLSQEVEGAVLVNLKGELVGVVSGGKIIPVNYFKNVIGQVLEGKGISRPVLGLKYFDLSHVDGLIAYGDKGALVYGNPARLSPLYNQVLDGDIVKKIDDVEINGNQSLSELISSYKTGDRPEFLIQRGDQELRFEATLK
ncbi:MAG: S1C family serine protease [Candidatus Buchananbacteria bacterium]|nr:S1C family serine protease [Candidatus Buchananbacteria bacterium]